MNKIERAARIVSRSGAGAVLRRLPTWSGVLTLCFHRIGRRGESAWETGLWDTTVDGLDRRLRFLRRHAEVISAEEMLRLEAPPHGRHVLLTFDDGYREWATDVLPVLRAHGLAAAFFVATGFIDRPRAPWWYELPWMVRNARRRELPAGDWLTAPLSLAASGADAAAALLNRYKELPGAETEAFLDWVGGESGSGRCDPGATSAEWLTWDLVRELRDAGMEIGGHTVDHPVLARLPGEEQQRQISGCARRIEEEVGRPMRTFAYPVGLRGTFDSASRAALEKEEVELAFAYDGGYLRAGAAFDRFAVPRVTGGMTAEILRATLALPQRFARW